MEFKLCRLFNTRINFPIFIVFLLMTGFMVAFEHELIIFNMVFVLAVFIFIHLYFCPSRFKIDNNEIIMRDSYIKDTPKISFVIRRGRVYRRMANLTISYITKIEYKSGAIERLFGVGKIIAYGKIELTKKNAEPVDDDDGKLKKFHKIYGIKHFSESKEKIKQAFPNAEHCEL